MQLTRPSSRRPGLRSRLGIPGAAEPLDTWAVAGLVLLVAEAAFALIGEPIPILSAAALALAPGLAVRRLLPWELARPLEAAATVPVAGLALSSIALISVAAIDVPLTAVSVRLVLLVLVLAGLVLGARVGGDRHDAAGLGSSLYAALGLAAALAIGAFLQGTVVHGSPVPGNDWAKYLLYADEIRAHHSLLIDNPFWMLGLPFSEDPGAPSVYGAFLLMSDTGASILSHGIWVFATLGVASTFALASVLWGRTAGVLAAALYAAIPMNQAILGFHGLANVYALMFVPFVLLPMAMVLRGRSDWRWGAVFAVAIVATAAGHRLTLVVTLGALALAAVIALALRQPLRLRPVAAGLALSLAVGAGVIVDLIRRQVAVGKSQGYEAYSHTHVDWSLLTRDLTLALTILGVASLVLLLVVPRLRRQPATPVTLGLVGAALLLAFGWIYHLPTPYFRSAYYFPLPLVLAVTAVWAALPQWRRLAGYIATAGAVVLVTLVAIDAHGLAGKERAFYRFSDDASLRGLGMLQGQLRKGDTVVADRCWSFLAPWLLQTPVLGALEKDDIFPAREAIGARNAQTILYGPTGQAGRLIRRYRVRYAVVYPTCIDAASRKKPAPNRGRPIFVSRRLAILALPR